MVDQDMKILLRNHRNNNKAAFALSTSGDFGHDRQMTAGVAVTFKEEFGKPTVWDSVASHLAHQQISNGAGIYSLITKLKYYHKPTITDYEKSFHELARDFKSRKYSTLFCSPMGCIRDDIQINTFVANIVRFQRETKATINVVTFDQYSRSRLRNKLDYCNFKIQLEEALKAEMNKISCTELNAATNIINATPNSNADHSLMSDSSPWRGWPDFTPSKEKSLQPLNSSPTIMSSLASTTMNTPTNTSSVIPTSPLVVPGQQLQYSEVLKISDIGVKKQSICELKNDNLKGLSLGESFVKQPTNVNSNIRLDLSNQSNTVDLSETVNTNIFLRNKEISPQQI